MFLLFANVIVTFAYCLVILMGGAFVVFKIPVTGFCSAAFFPWFCICICIFSHAKSVATK